MRWTTKKPEEEGTYWLRFVSSREVVAVEVKKCWGGFESLHHLRMYRGPVTHLGNTMWIGPIEKPEVIITIEY